MCRRHNEKRVHTVIAQIRIPCIAMAGLHLVFAAQRIQSGSRDVHTTRFTARFHVIGQRHIIGPHVELPFAQPQNAAEDTAGMDADTHVEVDIGGFDDGTE